MERDDVGGGWGGTRLKAQSSEGWSAAHDWSAQHRGKGLDIRAS